MPPQTPAAGPEVGTGGILGIAGWRYDPPSLALTLLNVVEAFVPTA